MSGLARRARQWLPPLVLLAVLLGVWQLWVVLGHTEPYVLPSPTRIARTAVDVAGLLPGHVATTAVEAVAGLLIGAALGAAIAALVALVPLARRSVEPLLVVSQTIPMIVLAPLLVLWFGLGMTPKIVVVVLISFFPVAISTAAGLRDADPELVDLLHSMGASRADVLRKVRIPAAVPAFFAGLRIAAAYAVTGAVIGEWIGASSGLGVFIIRSKASFAVDRIFVAVAVIALLSLVLFALVDLAARRAAPWKETP